MADSSSYRSSRTGAYPARGEASPTNGGRHPASDPLAELARLIGKDETFAALGRDGGRQRSEPAAHPADASRDPPWLARTDPYAPDRHAVQDQSSDYPRDAGEEALDLRPGRHHPSHDRDPRVPPEHGEDFDPYRESDELPPRADGEHAYYGDDGQPHPDDEEGYDEPPHKRRRGGLVTVAAVLGLAAIGTAGAFGYWAWSGGSGSTSEPPVIKADAAPSKIVPATQSGDASNKRIYDRVGEKGSGAGEKLVSREEQPVAPRVIFPGPGNLSGPAPSPATAPAPLATAAPTPPIEPKKVATFPIRPDQVGTAYTGPASGPLAPARPVTTTTISPPPPPAAPVGASGAPPKPAVARSPQQPITLSSRGATADPSEAPAPQARSAPPAARVDSGSYVVQVSSQKSEAEAQASFRVLQTKYPGVLGSRQVLVRRADLGEKGVYYRAVVGPFANREQANQLCESLKTAGGGCIVQKN